MSIAIGIDVGGTKVAGGLVRADGSVLEPVRMPTPSTGPEVLDTILRCCEHLLRAADRRQLRPVGVGVGTGGIVDPDSGAILSATSVIPGWASRQLGTELSQRLRGMPVKVDNDGNTFANAEHRWGAARGVGDAVFVAVGTGIGGGLVLGGHLWRGARLDAGEFGRVRLVDRMDRHEHPTLEDVASGPAMAREFARRSGSRQSPLSELVSRNPHDPRLWDVIAGGGYAVGFVMGGIAIAVGVSTVVIGGGVALIGPRYLANVTRGVRGATDGHDGFPVRLVGAALGATSSVAGAGALVLT